MILPDVNVLVRAFRSDSEHHDLSHRWLDAVVNRPDAYGVSPQVLVRLTTHPRIFARPSRLEEVLGFCGILMAQSNCQVIEPGPRHWSIFLDVCREAGATGNLFQDAWFAARRSNPVASGLPSIAISPDLKDCAGGRRRSASPASRYCFDLLSLRKYSATASE